MMGRPGFSLHGRILLVLLDTLLFHALQVKTIIATTSKHSHVLAAPGIQPVKKSHLLVTLGKATLLASLPVGQVDITCVAKLRKDVKLSRNYLCLYLPCKVCKLVSGWLNAERILCNPRTPEQVLIGQSSETLWEPGHCNEISRTCRSRRHRPLCFLPPEIFKIILFSLLI